MHERICPDFIWQIYLLKNWPGSLFMWQRKIVNYEYLFVYVQTRHINVAYKTLHPRVLCVLSPSKLKVLAQRPKLICCILHTSKCICHRKCHTKFARVARVHGKKLSTRKTGLNNFLLHTLFNVVDNIVQHCYTRFRLNNIVQYC